MVTDLDIATTIVTVPTVREPDGLAMSSRNRRLSPSDRARAAAVPAALHAAESLAAAGERDAGVLVGAVLELCAGAGLSPEYVALVDADTFLPLETLSDAPAVLAIAVDVGGTRLIDNVLIDNRRPATA
jgi:pantoate--beta-alanine ligase